MQLLFVKPGSRNRVIASWLSASTRYQILWLAQAPQRPFRVTPWEFLSIRVSAPPLSYGQFSGAWVWVIMNSISSVSFKIQTGKIQPGLAVGARSYAFAEAILASSSRSAGITCLENSSMD